MTCKDLKAYLENILDDLPIYVSKDGLFPLREDNLDIVTWGSDKYIGPTVLIIDIND